MPLDSLGNNPPPASVKLPNRLYFIPPDEPTDTPKPERDPRPQNYGSFFGGAVAYAWLCVASTPYSSTASEILAAQGLSYTAAYIFTDIWALLKTSPPIDLDGNPVVYPQKKCALAEKWLSTTEDGKSLFINCVAGVIVAASIVAGYFAESQRPGINPYPFDAAARTVTRAVCEQPENPYSLKYTSATNLCEWLAPKPR